MNTREFYQDELNNKKTIPAKKAFLTRSEKQLNEHLTDLLECESGGWLHGERITKVRIAKVKHELLIINELRQKL